MSKVKKRLLFVISFLIIIIGYYYFPYKYSKDYEIINDDDLFAKYKDYNIYIGNYEDLYDYDNSLNNIIVYDERDADDPSFKICDSYNINNSCDRSNILEVLLEYEKIYPSDWERTIDSMKVEWFIHNFCYNLNYENERSKDVDLNNLDEKEYDKKILEKILKL